MSVIDKPVSQAEYQQPLAWDLSTSIDLYDCDPTLIQNQESIEQFTRELCQLLEVQRFGPAQIVRFDDDPRVYGYSMVQLIETSLVSGHFAEESNTVYLDIFSCKSYDAAAAAYAQQFFKAAQVSLCSACAAKPATPNR
jgi:S-adenosylmethionine decarboxylase